MPAQTVTTKGQITLRKALLQHLRVQPGEKVSVVALPDGRIELRPERSAGKIMDVFDFLKRETGPRLLIKDIDEVAERGWAGRR